MRRLTCAALVLACGVASFAGCAAISGLDGITEQACAPNCDGGGASADGAFVPVDGSALPTDSTVADTAAADTTVPPVDGGPGDDSSLADTTGANDAAPVDGAAPDAAATDAGHDAGVDAGHDSGIIDSGIDAPVDGGPDTGCGPLNTVQNCSACNATCVANNATSPTCNGVTCSYTCSSNYLDCNVAKAPNLDGCECNAPGATAAQCCSGACPQQHHYDLDLVSSTFYDCVASGTYNATVARDACIAFTGDATQCTTGYYCPQFPDGGGDLGDQVCSDGPNAASCNCWAYNGSLVGLLSVGPGKGPSNCYCPTTTPHWN